MTAAEEADAANKAKSAFLLSISLVSYTHLDVYKRQVGSFFKNFAIEFIILLPILIAIAIVLLSLIHI